MSKEILFSDHARKKLNTGVQTLSQAVVSTLGPSGRNVIIEQEVGNPTSTKDGVTVAKSITLEEPVENLGAELVKQASIKTADQAGDGTTTSTLLASEIFRYGQHLLSEDRNAVEVKRGIDIATEAIVEYLEAYAKDITDEAQLKQVATISANNDPQVGELIATAMEKVGREGIVSIEESKTGETYLETVEGMQFNRGYKSPYFVTDNSSMQAILKDPYVLIIDKRITQVKELLNLLEMVSTSNKPLLIIAEDIDGEALSTLVVNKMRGILSTVAVKAPEYGDRRKAILEDIAVLTGGTVVSTEKGMRLDKPDPSWFGKARKITVSKDTTTIIDAQGDESVIVERVEEIKKQIESTVSPFEKETLQDRLAKFVGGVAIAHVGGHTEVEMREKKDRVEDALHATKAALEEGILPGGGIALYNAKRKLLTELDSEELSVTHPDQVEGIRIVLDACASPLHQILKNAGYDKEQVMKVVSDLSILSDPWNGYNPRTKTFVNMFDAGIIDPLKVTRLALVNAASVAGTMLTTEAVVYKKDRDEKKGGDFDLGGLM